MVKDGHIDGDDDGDIMVLMLKVIGIMMIMIVARR